MKCLNEDVYKKKEKCHFLYIMGKDDLIATRIKLLNIKYEFIYSVVILQRLLIIKYVYTNAVRLFCRNVYKLCCYV